MIDLKRFGKVVYKNTRASMRVKQESAYELLKYLIENGARFVTITGVDKLRSITLLYHFALDERQILTLELELPKSNARTRSITPILQGAEWAEREVHDLLGVEFEGHPNLHPLITPKEVETPMRSDRR